MSSGSEPIGEMSTSRFDRSVNSAMRDAQIGLSLLWVSFVYLRLALEPGSPWQGVLPRRWAAAAPEPESPGPGGGLSGGGMRSHRP